MPDESEREITTPTGLNQYLVTAMSPCIRSSRNRGHPMSITRADPSNRNLPNRSTTSKSTSTSVVGAVLLRSQKLHYLS